MRKTEGKWQASAGKVRLDGWWYFFPLLEMSSNWRFCLQSRKMIPRFQMYLVFLSVFFQCFLFSPSLCFFFPYSCIFSLSCSAFSFVLILAFHSSNIFSLHTHCFQLLLFFKPFLYQVNLYNLLLKIENFDKVLLMVQYEENMIGLFLFY